MKEHVMRKGTIALVVATLCLALACAAGCAPQSAGSADPAPSEGAATELSDTGDGAYHTAWESYSAADEECLGCHGGTREAVADLTADLGEWNPHRSIHGGYNSCHNCHAADKEITDNYCTHCHWGDALYGDRL